MIVSASRLRSSGVTIDATTGTAFAGFNKESG